jgi:hypothetical protein
VSSEDEDKNDCLSVVAKMREACPRSVCLDLHTCVSVSARMVVYIHYTHFLGVFALSTCVHALSVCPHCALSGLLSPLLRLCTCVGVHTHVGVARSV